MHNYIPITPPGLTETDLCTWIGEALPGDTLEYHRGFLAVDQSSGRFSPSTQKALRLLARRALWASNAGLVHLVQRRNGPNDFRPRKRRAAPLFLPVVEVA